MDKEQILTKNKNIDKVLNIYEYLGIGGKQQKTGNLYLGSVHALLRKEIIQERGITAILSLLINERYQSQKVRQKVYDVLFNLNQMEFLKESSTEQLNTILITRHLHIPISDHNYSELQKHFQSSYLFILRGLMGNFAKFQGKQEKQLLKKQTPEQSFNNLILNQTTNSQISANDLQSTGNVFVHCMCGISRSPTIIIAFLLQLKRDRPKILSFLAQNKLCHTISGIKANQIDLSTLELFIEFVRSKRSIVMPNEGFMKQLKNFYQKIDLGS